MSTEHAVVKEKIFISDLLTSSCRLDHLESEESHAGQRGKNVSLLCPCCCSPHVGGVSGSVEKQCEELKISFSLCASRVNASDSDKAAKQNDFPHIPADCTVIVKSQRPHESLLVFKPEKRCLFLGCFFLFVCFYLKSAV